jgi:ADP-ribose pyrophosphatase
MPAPRVTSTRLVYENRWLRVHKDRLERPDGSPGLYARIEKPPAAVIVPLDEAAEGAAGDEPSRRGRITCGRSSSTATRSAVASGSCHRDRGRAPPTRRELAEETGLRARELERLGSLFFAYGMSDQRFDVWRAFELESGEQALEATEADLRVGRFTVAELEAMIADGRVRDAATVAAWHLATHGA